jgi:hemolysin-activating ACP:hemolysin acyltransferase
MSTPSTNSNPSTSSAGSHPDEAARAASAARFRLFRPDRPVIALGLAVSHLMTKPAFANLKFGDWSRILVGQINRGHYAFAIDGNNEVQGFAGWALTTRDKAEAWVEGRRGLAYEDSLAGDCIVFNAWSANSRAVHRFLVDEARKIITGKQTMYFKRHYKDGSTRPVRLSVNDFVAGHIERKASVDAAG